MPKQLNNGQVTQSLQRAFGFKGRFVPMLDEVIAPVYIIADPSPAVPTRLCAANVERAADGITNAWLQLFNPIGSGHVVNVTNVVAASSQKEQFIIAFHDTPGFTLSPDNNFRDRRNTGQPTTEARSDPGVVGAIGARVALIDVDGALSQTAAFETQAGDPRQPLAVLREGQGIIVEQRALLISVFTVNFRYIEVPASEVNPAGGLP